MPVIACVFCISQLMCLGSDFKEVCWLLTVSLSRVLVVEWPFAMSPLQSSLALLGAVATPDERVLVCPVCGKEFRGRNLRQRRESHLLTHSGLRPHVCPHCPHRTALRSNLIKHIRAIHRVSPHSFADN